MYGSLTWTILPDRKEKRKKKMRKEEKGKRGEEVERMDRSGMAIAARGLAGLLAIAAIGGGVSYARSVVRRNGMIETSTAEDFAILDAGVKEEEVTGLWSKLEKEKGQYVYAVRFYADGKEYEYEISARNGEVLEKSMEKEGGVISPEAEIVPAAAEDTSTPGSETSGPGTAGSSKTQTAQSQQDAENDPGKVKTETGPADKEAGIGEEAARKIAVLDSGLEEKEVAGLWSKLDKEDGRYIYDVKFYADGKEYDYEILAEDGKILERDVDREKGMTAGGEGSPASADGYISVDEAKEIALRDAGRREDEVRFSSAKLDNDDGVRVYEIEFYAENLEYDYEIDAVSGRILESKVEEDDD
ncbi:MAG: hypothetical protein E7237_07975 [Sarcina sp.]|nr:hypothetical protein [Sarcina sp.]